MAVFLIVLIFVVLAKPGVGIPFFSASASRQSDMSYDVINGNETANLVNSGLWLQTNSFILFSNMEDSGRIYAVNDMSGQNVYKYCDDSARNLCELNGFTYYINESDNDRIYRIDTSKPVKGEKLTDDPVSQFCVADRIYYINNGDKNRIYRIDRDGKNKKKLCNDSALSLFQDYGNIYYISKDDNYIKRMTVNGKNNTKFIDDKAAQFFTYNNRIYYINLDDLNRIYSVANDGTGRRKESDYSAGCICFEYFTNMDDHRSI